MPSIRIFLPPQTIRDISKKTNINQTHSSELDLKTLSILDLILPTKNPQHSFQLHKKFRFQKKHDLFTTNKPWTTQLLLIFLFPCCALFWPFMIFKQTIFDFLHTPSIFFIIFALGQTYKASMSPKFIKKSIKFNVKNIHKKQPMLKI